MIHTYTLIHDDLPEIDNDDYRRGRKSCHVVYGSDIALLAGDALLSYAFNALANAEIDHRLKYQMLAELSEETGHSGLIAGQVVDIESENKKVSQKTLNFIHNNKTARMINIPVRFGCYMANAPAEDQKRLAKFSQKLGLAFQIVDDILDIEGSKATLGKSPGKDEKSHKATFPSVYGLERSRKMASELIESAKELLQKYDEKAKLLLMLCDFVLTRKF